MDRDYWCQSWNLERDQTYQKHALNLDSKFLEATHTETDHNHQVLEKVFCFFQPESNKVENYMPAF